MNNDNSKEKEKKDKVSWKEAIIPVGIFIVIILLLIFTKPPKITEGLDEALNEYDNYIINQSIEYLQNNNITIYGLTTCPYCKKQYESFGAYGGYLINESIYIYCDETPVEECNKLERVPSWVKNGEVIHTGYIQLNNIPETLETEN